MEMVEGSRGRRAGGRHPAFGLAAQGPSGMQWLCGGRKRHRGDSNPCGQSPMDFESISLAARTQCLACQAHPGGRFFVLAHTVLYMSQGVH